ncbi:hypothetical protein J4209_04870 [Candidatus Woesearchaeota archaeon]|nr:hypothetical protein [Candidatus Woesearchaeota archaeon]
MRKFRKIWRKLTIQEKTDILIDKFNLNMSDIERSRKFKDGKRRLIGAARLQFKSFGNIHTDLTACIAGYKSDAVVRAKFGSSLNLREHFIESKIKHPLINPSWMDIKRDIRIPNKMNALLAEEIGIHIGDGSLSQIIANKAKKWYYYRYRLTGDLTDEYIYHKKFIFPLLNHLYNCPPVFTINQNKNSIQTIVNSKAVFEYKTKILNLPKGPKNNISIPNVLFNNQEFIKRCAVGIIDTDFTISPNLSIQGSLTSLNIINQLHEIFKDTDIMHSLNIKNEVGYIRIHKKSSIRIIKEWGLHNPKHLSKYHLHIKYGKSPTFTKTNERLTVLNGKMEFEELNRISEERRNKTPQGRFTGNNLPLELPTL